MPLLTLMVGMYRTIDSMIEYAEFNIFRVLKELFLSISSRSYPTITGDASGIPSTFLN
jgi:hypothetical protein